MSDEQIKSPVHSVTSLAAEDTLDRATNSEVLDFPHRIERYSRARKRAYAMHFYLNSLSAAWPPLPPAPRDFSALPDTDYSVIFSKLSIRLKHCGNWLHFRNFYTVDSIRLINANFCKVHLLCPLCAIRRGAKYLASYLDRYKAIKQENPNLKPYLITFTVKNSDDLIAVFNHLKKSLKLLLDRRRKYISASNRNHPYTEIVKVLGAVYSFELTNIGNGWHPHVHMIALCEDVVSQVALRQEWLSITKDSYIVDVKPFTSSTSSGAYLPEVEAFVEVFKYAVKFSDLSFHHNVEAFLFLQRQRLVASFGLFRSVTVPDSLLDEPLSAEELPYIDLLYKFVRGHYNLANILHSSTLS